MDFFEGQYGHQKEDGQGDVKAHAAQDACGEALGEENGLSNGEDGRYCRKEQWNQAKRMNRQHCGK